MTFPEGLPSLAYGDCTVMDIEVIGNMLGFGLPANIDIMPGVNSSGMSPRTNGSISDVIHKP
jgi:hypothetical protein